MAGKLGSIGVDRPEEQFDARDVERGGVRSAMDDARDAERGGVRSAVDDARDDERGGVRSAMPRVSGRMCPMHRRR